MPTAGLRTILTPFNRPHSADEDTAAFLYALYQLLRDAPASMSNHAKKRTFESAADGAHAWRVVCISENALRHIAEKETAVGLRRAHALSREARFQLLFGDVTHVWERDDLLNFFFEHDTCALVTEDENNQDTTEQWSQLHRVDEGYLCKGSFAVYARRKTDVPWAKKLWAEIQTVQSEPPDAASPALPQLGCVSHAR